MKIDSVARILLGTAALSWLLVSAGCNNALTGNNNTSTDQTASSQSDPEELGHDWGSSLLAGGTAGIGMFPAKYTFDVTATPSCTNDYVAYNTSLAGVTPTAAASQTGIFVGAATAGQTVTIANPSFGTSIVLTASDTLNTGLNFLDTGGAATEAINLAAAITRNGASVGVTATAIPISALAVNATANGSAGNSVTLATTISGSNFQWSGATLTGGTGTANIVAFNHLYSTQGSVGGLCSQNGPSVDWAYTTGTGTAVTSITLAGDGSKVVFVENVSGTATLRILQWKAGEGTGTGYPAVPTSTLGSGTAWTVGCPAGVNSCLSSIAFSGGTATDTNSPPFYDFRTDSLYVGDNSGALHKFTGIFNGTPAEVTTNWPITVHSGAVLTGPVYDSQSGNIFVGDSTGRLSYVLETTSTSGACASGSAPCLGTPSLQVGTGGSILDTPIVDGSTGRVFAVNGTETSANHGTILQASNSLSGAVSFKVGGTSNAGVMYGGAFDHTYFSSSAPSIAGHMYMCGRYTGFGDTPAIYQMNFTAATGVLSSVGASSMFGFTTFAGVICSPVTEFYNPNGGGLGVGVDWIFFSIGNHAKNGAPVPNSGCRGPGIGCVMSINVTGSPSWPPASATRGAAVPGNNAGSTSGFVVDNTSTSPQNSSFYFSLGTNSTGTGPGVPSCYTTAGVGCAVKLTQSALN